MNGITLTNEQLEILLRFAKEKVRKLNPNQICNKLGLNKNCFTDMRISGKTDSGYNFGSFVDIETEHLSGYFFRDSGYRFRFKIFKDYKGEYYTTYDGLSFGTKIKFPKKVLKELNIVE